MNNVAEGVLRELERAVAIAEVDGVHEKVALITLLTSVKRVVREMRTHSTTCPSCGQPNMGAHYCVGSMQTAKTGLRDLLGKEGYYRDSSEILKDVWPGCDTSKIGAW